MITYKVMLLKLLFTDYETKLSLSAPPPKKTTNLQWYFIQDKIAILGKLYQGLRIYRYPFTQPKPDNNCLKYSNKEETRQFSRWLVIDAKTTT